jgi:hypothetical protein
MANSVLNIIIKLIKQGGADKETVSGLYQIKRSLLDAAAVAGTFVAAGYAVKKGLDETVGSLVAYADEVRRTQNTTGLEAEDASKLIQILGDQKISYEQLEKVIRTNGKAYDFSAEGLAKMSDEYLTLGNAQEQAAFMQERFGKQWIDFVPVMQKGGDAIRDAADAVSENLVLTQQAVDQAREYEVGMDNLSDSVQGFKIALGQEAIPVVNQFVDGLNVWVRAIEIAKEKNDGGIVTQKEWKAALEEATVEVAQQKLALNDHATALDGDTTSATDNAAAIQAVSAANQSMLSLIGTIAGETQSYTAKQAELTTKMQENRAEAEKLYPWQSQQLSELNGKYADMEATYAANAAAHTAAMGKIQYDLYVTQLSVGGLDDAEKAMAEQAGLAFGVFDQASINSATNMNIVTQAVIDGKLRIEDMQKALEMLPESKSIDIVINTIQNLSQGALASNGQSGYSQLAGNNGYAAGGIATGPSTGHWELLHGTEAIIPLEGGAVPVALSGAQPSQGGGDVYVRLTVKSPITIMDEQLIKNTLLPFIINGLREAKARGLV